jgi:hypothetical protein
VNSEFVKDVGRSHAHSCQDESQDAFRKVKGCTVSNTLVDHIRKEIAGASNLIQAAQNSISLAMSVLD